MGGFETRPYVTEGRFTGEVVFADP